MKRKTMPIINLIRSDIWKRFNIMRGLSNPDDFLKKLLDNYEEPTLRVPLYNDPIEPYIVEVDISEVKKSKRKKV